MVGQVECHRRGALVVETTVARLGQGEAHSDVGMEPVVFEEGETTESVPGFNLLGST